MDSETPFARILLVLLLALILLPLVPMLLFMPTMWMYGWGNMDGTMWGTMGGTWFIIPWLFVVLLLLGGGYLLVRTLGSADDGGDPALAELRLAYARGDLTEEEFEERRGRLSRED